MAEELLQGGVVLWGWLFSHLSLLLSEQATVRSLHPPIRPHRFLSYLVKLGSNFSSAARCDWRPPSSVLLSRSGRPTCLPLLVVLLVSCPVFSPSVSFLQVSHFSPFFSTVAKSSFFLRPV